MNSPSSSPSASPAFTRTGATLTFIAPPIRDNTMERSVIYDNRHRTRATGDFIRVAIAARERQSVREFLIDADLFAVHGRVAGPRVTRIDLPSLPHTAPAALPPSFQDPKRHSSGERALPGLLRPGVLGYLIHVGDCVIRALTLFQQFSDLLEGHRVDLVGHSLGHGLEKIGRASCRER